MFSVAASAMVAESLGHRVAAARVEMDVILGEQVDATIRRTSWRYDRVNPRHRKKCVEARLKLVAIV